MTTTTRKWIHGLGAAFIGGGAAAVVSGLTSMGIAPEKFNLQNASGMLHLLGLVAANFIFNGILSAMFFLRQAPLPDGDISTVAVSSVTHSPDSTTVTESKTTVITDPQKSP